jgi:hypothetical protein
VDVGCFIEEAFRAHFDKPNPKFVADYQCQIRTSLRKICGLEGWGWSASCPKAELIVAISKCFEMSAVPFFHACDSRGSILETRFVDLSPTIWDLDKISRAAILANLGKTGEALDCLESEFRSRESAPAGSRDLVLAAAERIGIRLRGI